MVNNHIEIVIRSAQHGDDQQWDQQVATIRKSGATFDPSSKNWRLKLDPTDGPRIAVALSWLYVAARDYNTTVLVLDPIEGVPGLGTDLSATG